MLMLWVVMLSGAIHGREPAVEIVRGVDDHLQPGWVEAEIVDGEALSEMSMTHQSKK